MRLFVGVPLAEHVRNAVYEKARELERDGLPAKFVERENLHITLKFIGDVSREQAERIASALRAVVFNPFEIEVKGAGMFGSRVLWAGVEKGRAELCALAEQVEGVLEAAGISRDARPFHPHVTIARLKGNVSRALRFVKETTSHSFGTMRVDKIVLFKSTLTPRGPVYEEVVGVEAKE